MSAQSLGISAFRGKLHVDVPTYGRETRGLGRGASYEAATRGDFLTVRTGRSLVVPLAPALARDGYSDEMVARLLGLPLTDGDAGVPTPAPAHTKTYDGGLHHDCAPEPPDQASGIRLVDGL